MNFWLIFWMGFSIFSLIGCIVGLIYFHFYLNKEYIINRQKEFNRDVEYIEKLILEKDYTALFFVGQLYERYSLAWPDNKLLSYV